MDLAAVLSIFLTRLIGGYALCLGLVGPIVTEGPWRRISLWVIAGLCVVALAAGAPWLPCVATAGAALVIERAHTFGIPGVRSPIWMLPLGVWLAAANERPGLDMAASGILAGGTLATMLLGHGYLIARKLSFTPLKRMAWLLFAILIARAVLVAPVFFGARLDMMDWVFLSMRSAFGLVLPLVFAWMVIQCVKIESNQSATGILYGMTALVFLGELTAVYLAIEGGIAA
jgi:hypothetical protein